MSDVILYLSVAGALTVILCIISLIFRRRTAGNDDNVSDELRGDEDAAVINRQAAPRRVAGARQVRSRFEAQRARQEQRRATQAEPDFDRQSGSDDEEDDGGGADDIVFPGGKIGVKKRRKLEMKAEKRAQREAELQDREEKKTRQALQDEDRRRKEELQKQEELKREEEAKKMREEKAKREHEAYLQLKQSFQVESEGFEEKDNEDQENDLLTKFVDYIKAEKVVVLEDLAVRFNLKTQDAIDRLQSLLQDGRLIGVIDDRGKFIYITAEELESIARFIRQRGRVSITDIAESSNTLISLASKQPLESNV